MKRPIIGLSMNFMKLGQYHQFHIRDRYVDAVFRSDALPLLIPCLDDEQSLIQYLEGVGALVIIGGLDYPPSLYEQEVHPMADLAHERRVSSDLLLLKLALQMEIPILGICAGLQLMNIYFGGKLIQHITQIEAHLGEKYHTVSVLGGKWLPRIYPEKTLFVNSNHHQAIDPEYLGEGLQVVAVADDGIIEAVEYPAPQMVLGIQWHPERIADPKLGKIVFDFLSNLAAKHKEASVKHKKLDS